MKRHIKVHSRVRESEFKKKREKNLNIQDAEKEIKLQKSDLRGSLTSGAKK